MYLFTVTALSNSILRPGVRTVEEDAAVHVFAQRVIFRSESPDVRVIIFYWRPSHLRQETENRTSLRLGFIWRSDSILNKSESLGTLWGFMKLYEALCCFPVLYKAL